MTGAYWFTITIGAIFYYIISGFADSFEQHNLKIYRKRNLWTGFTMQLILACVIIYLIIKSEF